MLEFTDEEIAVLMTMVQRSDPLAMFGPMQTIAQKLKDYLMQKQAAAQALAAST